MEIRVIPTAQQAQDIDYTDSIAVVIDVLRATSVITTALSHGACEVIPVKTVEKAQWMYATMEVGTALLGGERHALRVEGFDLSNSPLEYTKEKVWGKTLILTTTNGTKAINNIKNADEIVLACFRNAAAVVDFLAKANKNVVIVCAGTEDKFSLDDGLNAGMLISLLKQKTEVETDDLGFLLDRYYENSKADLLAALSGCYHLQRLITLGFEDDIRFCLERNVELIVPVFADGKVV